MKPLLSDVLPPAGVRTRERSAGQRWDHGGHANGTATVINHLSASGPSFKEQVYYRWGGMPGIDPLNGD
jgi:hypothetical protein